MSVVPDSPPGVPRLTGRRATVCLCMIVRDEVDVIRACLESARPLIDTWVICDTGSSDGTPELIRKVLAGIPGQLHHHAWVDFAHNRTLMMRLARWRADYLLILDADNVIEPVDGGLTRFPATAGSYLIPHESGTRYSVERLVSGRLDWYYVGAVHEYIECATPHSRAEFDGLLTHNHSVGAIRHGRWERDAEILEAAVSADPDDTRARFYLARTYHDLGLRHGDRARLTRAQEHYDVRATMGGWDEEVYYSLHQAGVLCARLGRWPDAQARLIEAWQARPVRLEAVYDLADGLIARGRHASALAFTSLATERTLAPPADLLFVTPWVYLWGLAWLHSVALLGDGRWDESIAVSRRLLARTDLSSEQREAVGENIQAALRGKSGAMVSELALREGRLP